MLNVFEQVHQDNNNISAILFKKVRTSASHQQQVLKESNQSIRISAHAAQAK